MNCKNKFTKYEHDLKKNKFSLYMYYNYHYGCKNVIVHGQTIYRIFRP